MATKKNQFDSTMQDVRDMEAAHIRGLSGKSISVEALTKMLLERFELGYEIGFRHGKEQAQRAASAVIDELEKLSLRHSAEAFDIAIKEGPRLHGKEGAKKKARKPGGKNDKTQFALQEWATGRYRTHEDCAFKVVDLLAEKAIKSSFSRVMTYLAHAPNPDPWPAKRESKAAR